jgi:ATP-dependent Lhr-like helicase
MIFSSPRNVIHYVDDQAGFAHACGLLMREPFLGFDVETTLRGKPPRVCLMQVATPSGDTWLFDNDGVEDMAPFAEVLQNDQIVKVIHNALFEKLVMRQYGVSIFNVFDTLTVSRRLRKDVEGGHSLKAVCKRELNMDINKKYQCSNWSRRPLSPEQIDYAALDAEVLVTLYEIFRKEL